MRAARERPSQQMGAPAIRDFNHKSGKARTKDNPDGAVT
jgi:hypothetical protein